jgi:hypothetical protein
MHLMGAMEALVVEAGGLLEMGFRELLEPPAMEPQTLAAAAAVERWVIELAEMGLVQMAALVWSLFPHLKQPHLPPDRLQLQQAVAGQSTPSRPLAASHSEVNDEHSKLARWRNQQDTPNSVWTLRDQHSLGRVDNPTGSGLCQARQLAHCWQSSARPVL